MQMAFLDFKNKHKINEDISLAYVVPRILIWGLVSSNYLKKFRLHCFYLAVSLLD